MITSMTATNIAKGIGASVVIEPGVLILPRNDRGTSHSVRPSMREVLPMSILGFLHFPARFGWFGCVDRFVETAQVTKQRVLCLALADSFSHRLWTILTFRNRSLDLGSLRNFRFVVGLDGGRDWRLGVFFFRFGFLNIKHFVRKGGFRKGISQGCAAASGFGLDNRSRFGRQMKSFSLIIDLRTTTRHPRLHRCRDRRCRPDLRQFIHGFDIDDMPKWARRIRR